MLDVSRKNLYLAALGFLASAEAFSISGPLFRAQTNAALSLRNGGIRQSSLGLRMSSNDPKIVYDSMSGWKPDHQKAGDSGNVDTPDYFEGDGQNAGDLGFKSGAAATGGSQQNKLSSLLSADKTEIRTVQKQSYGKVEFKMPKQAWKVDGTYESGDPKFNMLFSLAEMQAETEIYIEPSAMTYEDFFAGFVESATDPGFTVEPASGTMNRRGGEGTEFIITYKGSSLEKEDKFATFVVMLPNDNFQWTYKLRVSFPK